MSVRRKHGFAAAWCVALLLAPLVLLATVLHAQTGTGSRPTDEETAPVIITHFPPDRAAAYAVLRRSSGMAEGKRLEMTGSELWHVRRSEIPAVLDRLGALGCAVIDLSERGGKMAFDPQSVPRLNEPQRKALMRLKHARGSDGATLVSMPHPAVIEHALMSGSAEAMGARRGAMGIGALGKVMVPISDGTSVALVRTRPTIRTEGAFTWFGEVEATGERAILMLWPDGQITGYLGYRGKIYSVEPVEGRVHAVAEMDPVMLPPDHAPLEAGLSRMPSAAAPGPPEPRVEPFNDAERLRLESKEVVIDLMMLYTANAASRYAAGARLLAPTVETINETFRNSGLGNIRLRLVHTAAVDYDEQDGEAFDHLYRMVDGVGAFKDVRRLRDEKRADIVGLILHNPQGCGLSTRVGADAEEAFFIVHHACAGITFTIGHEIGHILGARHDRRFDPSERPAPYAHGYVNGLKWRTMMSYQASCGGCPRIPYWSNPRVLYKGEPTGTAASDNARIILENAERVSLFR